MEEAIIENFENMCRLCMTVGNESLQSLFNCIEGIQNREIYIFDMVQSTIHQLPKIEKSDELPKVICGSCMEKLLAYYEFQQCCISADMHLRSIITTNTMDYVSENSQSILDPLEEEEDNKSFEFPHVEFIKKEELINEAELLNESFHDEQENGDATPGPLNEPIQTSDKAQFEMLIPEVPPDNYDGPQKTIKDGRSSLSCKVCKKGFATKKYLTRHIKRMHPREDLPDANDCKPKIESAEGNLYKCDECGSEFGKKVYLRKHKYRHKRPGGMRISKKCDSCDMVFHTVQALKKHCLIVHNDVLHESNNSNLKKPYVCEYCNKSFQQSCTLKEHIRIHTNETPYLCSDCGKAFRSNSNLKQHLLRHTGEKRYECPDCPKKFPCLSDLSSHKQVHKNFRPHVCVTCGAAFGKYSQLKKHNMYHSGEKPHQCEYCEMRFVCADHMRRHMRTHTGEKPYKCKYCPRTFTQSNDMVKHLRSHLGVNVYQCELCPSAFRLAAELRQHFALHKNDDEETRERNKRELLEAQEKLRQKLEKDYTTNVVDKE